MSLNLETRQRNLKFAFREGLFSSGMTGFTQDYFIPFVLLLGATTRQVGILSAIPNFVSALTQLATPELVEAAKSRKKIVTIFVFIQMCVLIPIAWMAFHFHTDVLPFLIFVTLFTATGALALPAWGSLMSNLVDENTRGEFFGRRNKILGVVMIFMSFVAGFILHWMQLVNIYHGFAIIFACAGIFRFVSWLFILRMHEPVLEHKKEDHFTFFMFLRRFRESNFAQFVIFVASFSFSVSLASPFFAVMMLRELKFGYLLYTVLNLTATLLIHVLMKRWGRHADRVGNLRIMRLTAPIIATIPLMWLINRDPIFLFFAQVISGFAWSGFSLCASNFILDAVTPQKRTRCIAYFNFINGFALCLGPLIGGLLIDKLPKLFGYQLLALFLISAMLRSIFAYLGHRNLKEVRVVEKVGSMDLILSMLGLKPLFGIKR